VTSDQPVTSDTDERPTAALIDEVDRVRGLAAMDMLAEWLACYSIERAVSEVTIPRTAAERHLRETGHRLAFGCCRAKERRLEAA